MNKADTARRAVEYLVQHDFKLHWDYDPADPPPEEIKRLLAPYFDDGEIERTTGMLLCNYLVGRLREDYVPQDEWSRSARGHAPHSRPPTCRVV